MSALRPRLRFLFTSAARWGARGGLVGVIAGGAAVQFGWLECVPAFRALIDSPGVMIFGGLVGLIPAVAVFARLAQEAPRELHLFALWDLSVYAWLLPPSLLIVVGAALLAPYALAAGCGFLACGAATGAAAFLVQAVCRDTPPLVPDEPAPADPPVAGARRTVLGLPARVWSVLLVCTVVGAAIRTENRLAHERRARGPSDAPLKPAGKFTGRIDDLVANPAGVTEAELEGLTDEDVRRLAPLTDLTRLGLKQSRVTDAGLKELAALSHLTHLDLRGRPVTDAGLAHVARLTALTRLNLSNTSVTDGGLGDLGRLPNLTELDLSGCRVTDAGARNLGRLTGLTTLDLSGTGVTDPGIKALTPLPTLAVLRLSGTRVTDAGVEDLSRLTMLITLELPRPGVSDAALETLRTALPRCRVNGVSRYAPVPPPTAGGPNPPARGYPWGRATAVSPPRQIPVTPPPPQILAPPRPPE